MEIARHRSSQAGQSTNVTEMSEADVAILVSYKWRSDATPAGDAASQRRSAIAVVIHAAMTPENVLRNGGRLMLIDFDDAGFGWPVFELATALFWHIDRPYYRTIHDPLVAGYRSVRQLSAVQWQKLPLFLYLRGLTYLGWVQARSETKTARELAPMLIEKVVVLASKYLERHGSLRAAPASN